MTLANNMNLVSNINLSMENFDFKNKWNECVPHLKNLMSLDNVKKDLLLIRTVATCKFQLIDFPLPLPPLVHVIIDLPNLYKNFSELKKKWDKPIDTESVNANYEIFTETFSGQEEMIINVVSLLERAGYSANLENHSTQKLSDFFIANPLKIEWYIVPHFCVPWNDCFSYKLAQLVCPEEKWSYRQMFDQTGNEVHCTVINENGKKCFDILLWYEGGSLDDNWVLEKPTFLKSPFEKITFFEKKTF